VDLPDWITVEEAAELLGLPEQDVYRLAFLGEIRYLLVEEVGDCLVDRSTLRGLA
jgi:excisionase family DNA binding protein